MMEQARTSLFKLGQQRSFEGLVHLDDAARDAMPKMISTDAHVDEPDALWNGLPPRLRAELPDVRFGECPPGARDPRLRLLDQVRDGVEAEVLFPNYGMILFSVDNVELQREAFRLYNDWIADYCSHAPKNLIGVPCLSVYDIDAAIAEMHRALDLGLKGAMIWEVADPKLPFTSDHYERLWAAAGEAGAPIHCHILTGHSYAKDFEAFVKSSGIKKIHEAVNLKTADAANTLFEFIFSGAFERHPKLKLVLAESEVGWIPFLLQQWDYYFEKMRKRGDCPIRRRPSEIFDEHVYCTFLDDFAGTRAFPHWGVHNCMWSNDYPHVNMTFPHSRDNVERHLQGLDEDVRLRLVRQNAIELYGLNL
jgi:uncharacterized protein